MPPQLRLRLLLRGVAKLVAVVVVAGAAGVGLGIGLSKLAGDDSTSNSADTPAIRTQASTSTGVETAAPRLATARDPRTTGDPGAQAPRRAAAGDPQTTGDPGAPAPRPAAAGDPRTTGDPGAQAQTPTTHTSPTRRPRASRVRVQVVSVVLHRELGRSGRPGRRARLAVHVRVANRGKRTIAKLKPVLVAGARLRPDPSPRKTVGSLLRPVSPGATADGTLRFATAGATTARLVKTHRAQLRIAGKTATLTVQIGSSVRSGKSTR